MSRRGKPSHQGRKRPGAGAVRCLGIGGRRAGGGFPADSPLGHGRPAIRRHVSVARGGFLGNGVNSLGCHGGGDCRFQCDQDRHPRVGCAGGGGAVARCSVGCYRLAVDANLAVVARVVPGIELFDYSRSRPTECLSRKSLVVATTTQAQRPCAVCQRVDRTGRDRRAGSDRGRPNDLDRGSRVDSVKCGTSGGGFKAGGAPAHRDHGIAVSSLEETIEAGQFRSITSPGGTRYHRPPACGRSNCSSALIQIAKY